jgi:hypothetical protein
MANTHSLDEHLAALDLALSELQQALDAGEASVIFQRLGSALHWMYAATEPVRTYSHSGAMGGLRWVRGKVTHIGVAVREQRVERAHTYVRQNSKWVPTTVRVRENGQWLPVAVRVSQPFWADLGDLGRRNEVGARLYAEHVADRQLMVPLKVARGQLEEIVQTVDADTDGRRTSPRPDSNRRPLPYHGSALPTELRGREGGA